MRKVFTIAVLALLGTESLGQSFRHHQGPLINSPTPPSAFAFDEVEDNEMALVWGHKFKEPLSNRPQRPILLLDDFEDNEMALGMGQTLRDSLINRSVKPKHNMAVDDFEDNNLVSMSVPRGGGVSMGGPRGGGFGMRFDDVEDNEMALGMGQTLRDSLINRSVKPKRNMAVDDAEDNELCYGNLGGSGRGGIGNIGSRGGWGTRFDDVEDNEMALGMGQTLRDSLINRSVKPKHNMAVDDFEDNNLVSINFGGSRGAGVSMGGGSGRGVGMRFDDFEDNEMALGMGQNLRDSLINRSQVPRGHRAFDDFEDENF